MKNRPVSPALAAFVALLVSNLALPPDLRSQTCPDGGTIKPQTTLQEAIKAISVNLTNLCAVTPVTPTATPAPNAVPLSNSIGILAPDWTKRTRVVTVSSIAGEANFTTISAACAYVATQSPSISGPWTIIVFPGVANTSGIYNYLESTPFTVPTNTSIQGLSWGSGSTPAAFAEAPIIRLACTSGTCMTIQGGDSFNNLLFRWNETPTAAVKVVEAVQGASTQGIGFYNTSINVAALSNAFAMDAFTNTTGSSYFYLSGINMSGNALGRALVQADTSGRGVTIYSGRFKGSSGCATLMENTNTGVLNLYPTRLDAGCTFDLKNSSTGSIFVAPGTSYGPVSGTVANGNSFTAYGATNPATCSPGQDFTNTATPAMCRCITTNTWKCITLL